jgi:limonene-1,2-epoxide hydrolase
MVTFQPDGKAALDAAYHNQAADAADLLEERADDHTVLVATAATVGVVGVGVAVFEGVAAGGRPGCCGDAGT